MPLSRDHTRTPSGNLEADLAGTLGVRPFSLFPFHTRILFVVPSAVGRCAPAPGPCSGVRPCRARGRHKDKPFHTTLLLSLAYSP